jgi:branched-chain amino acid transport system permease protein
MTASTLIIGTINGFFLGGLYVIAALGLGLIFGVMRLVNVAHGDLLILGAYLTITLAGWLRIDPLLAALLAAPLMFLVGYPLQSQVFHPLMGRGAEPPLLAAFGVAIIAQNLFLLIWGADTRALQTSYSTQGVSLLGVNVPLIYLIAFAIALALVAATEWLITRTRIGRAIRAAAQDPATAAVMGIDPRQIYALTYGIGAATAALGGGLIALTFSVTPSAGLGWLLKGFVVVVLGGMGSLRGALAAGLLLGVAEGLGGAIFGTGYRDMIGYLIFVLVLLLRPNGLFSLRGRLA